MEIDKYIGANLTSFNEFIELVQKEKKLIIKDDVRENNNIDDENNENLNIDIKIIQKGSKSQHAIPESLRKCISINLHLNRLSNLIGLPILYYIKELNLSSNLFISSDLPELTYLPSLKILDLSGNMIDSVLLFPYLPQLAKLLIAFNPINSFETLYESVPNLLYLDIRGNNVPSISNNNFISSISNLTQLVELLIDGKKFNGITILHSKDIINIFNKCTSIQIINNKSIEEWNIEYNNVEECKSLSINELEAKSVNDIKIIESKVSFVENNKIISEVLTDNIVSIPSSENESSNQESDTSIEFVNTPRFDSLAMKFRSSHLSTPNSLDNSLNSNINSPSNNNMNNFEIIENDNNNKIEVEDIEIKNISNNDNNIDTSSYSLEMIDNADIVEDLDQNMSLSDIDTSVIKNIEENKNFSDEKDDDFSFNRNKSLINSKFKYCDSIYNIFDIGMISDINTSDNSITNMDNFVSQLYFAIPCSSITILDLNSKQESDQFHSNSFIFKKKQVNECDKIYDLMDIKSETDNINVEKSIKTIPNVEDIIFKNKNKVIRKKIDIKYEKTFQETRKINFYNELDVLFSSYQSQMDTNIKLQIEENELSKKKMDSKINDLVDNETILISKLQESTDKEKNINTKYQELNESYKTLTLSLEEINSISATNIKQLIDIQNLETNIEKYKNIINNSSNTIEIQDKKIIDIKNQLLLLESNSKEKDTYIETYTSTKENELIKLMEELKISKEICSNLNQTNNNVTLQNDKYIKTIEQLRSCISKFQNHINKLTKLPCQFCENNEQLNKIKNENSSTIDVNNSKIIEIEHKLISQTEELKLIKTELDNKDIKNEELFINLKIKDKQLNDKISQITDLRNKLILYENENQRNQYSINGLEESLNKMRLIVNGLENELNCKSKIEKELKKLLKELENN